MFYDPRFAIRGPPSNMRIVLVAAASILSIALACAPRPALAVDCSEVRASCLDHCRTEVDATRARACANRCSVAFCQDTSRFCRPGDQKVCTDGFRSCNTTCAALASIPTAAAAVGADACVTKCCSQFKACLNQRSCDTSTLNCRR